jgi:hypothetical protein
MSASPRRTLARVIAEIFARLRERKPSTPRQWAHLVGTIGAAAGVVLGLAWLGTGAITARSSGCVGCHSRTVHSATPKADVHHNASCVDCHEPGHALGQLVINVPERLQHFAFGRSDKARAASYGTTISSARCAKCHASAIASVAKDTKRGLKVSHKEPLAAGAECMDCHMLVKGQMAEQTVGMSPCLRCHDGKDAKATCSVCHDGNPADGIVGQDAKTSLASRLLPVSPCEACHTNEQRCDACHGLRLPHTTEFTGYGHAKPAALDIWDNGGKLCSSCHRAGHRSCVAQGCHSSAFPGHPLSWKTQHQQSSWSKSDSECRCHGWVAAEHDGMVLCQVCHATKPEGARP